jgi:hypothetical protein
MTRKMKVKSVDKSNNKIEKALKRKYSLNDKNDDKNRKSSSFNPIDKNGLEV